MSAPPLGEFLQQAEAWLAARYPAVAEGGQSRFTWGQGNDEVRVFQEPDPVAEADALPAIRRWRQELWDHGYGWIAGPPEYGGAGPPPPDGRGVAQLGPPHPGAGARR